MKVCFQYEDFDIDVSSGTYHALSQWVELLLAFDVEEFAVINHTEETIPLISSEIPFTVFDTITDFLDSEPGSICSCEMGGEDYRDFDFSKYDWVVFGGVEDIAIGANVGIETRGHALYPREAAAIILAAL